MRAETESLFDYQLRQMALSLRDQGEVAPAQASALVDQQLDFVVQVWTADGRAIYASRAHAALPQRAQLGLADVSVAGQVWRSFSVAMPSRVIQVSQPLAIRRKLAADAAWRAVLPLLLVAPLMAAAAWWLTALALRPLQRVAAGVRQRDEQSLEPLPSAGLPDEVAPLVTALNALLQRLGQSLDTQRAFVADAAHELRSPLTALKLQLQLLKRAGSEAERTAAAQALAAGIDRAARLVEQMLTLARTEPGAAAPPLQRLDLSELVREAVADTVPLALARGTKLELHRRCAGGHRRRSRRAQRAGAQPGRQRGALFAAAGACRAARVASRRRAHAAGGRCRPRHPARRARARVRPLLPPRPGRRTRHRAWAWPSCAAWRSATAPRWRWTTRRWAGLRVTLRFGAVAQG